jgi:hypothetical protein
MFIEPYKYSDYISNKNQKSKFDEKMNALMIRINSSLEEFGKCWDAFPKSEEMYVQKLVTIYDEAGWNTVSSESKMLSNHIDFSILGQKSKKLKRNSNII